MPTHEMTGIGYAATLNRRHATPSSLSEEGGDITAHEKADDQPCSQKQSAFEVHSGSYSGQ